MSDDSAQRTEQPTARRLKRSRDEGQVARSVELSAAAVMFGAVLVLLLMGPVWFAKLARYFAAGFSFDRKVLETPALLPLAFSSQMSDVFLLFLPMMVLTLFLAVLASGATGGFLFSLKAVLPKFSKLSPLAGLKKMLGTHAAIELVKSILKFGLIASVLLILLNLHFSDLIGMGSMGLEPAFSLTGTLIFKALIWLTLGLVLIALVDVPFQRYTFMKRMRMTKQEIRDEYKDMEGRPEVKAQLRRRQREIANARMMQKVKDADVIITNPEHFAIALAYDPTSDGAPILLAKGADFMAMLIRKEAKVHGIEIFEAPQLARALFFTTELDQAIPETLYFAVAQVIAYVFGLANVRPGVAPMARPQPKIPQSVQFDATGKPYAPEKGSP